MKMRIIVSAAVLGMATAGQLHAQCSGATVTQQACKASVDLVNYMTPQLATSIAAGSSTLGQSGVLGGLGRFAVSVRATAVVNGAIPDVADRPFRVDGAPESYTTTKQIIPGVGVDGSVGITKGMNLGATRVGGIDVLVSALYMPEADIGDFSLKAPDGSLKLGYGVRVGLLEESIASPGLYVSYLQRDLPTITLSGTSGVSTGAGTASGTFSLNDFSVKTSAIRLVAAKGLGFLSVQAGVGQDTYKATANIAATVNGQGTTGVADMKMTRNNVFGGLMLNLVLLKVVAEAGQVMGGSLATPFNNFDKKADESRTYISGGIRIAF
jgi:hypothetical protein